MLVILTGARQGADLTKAAFIAYARDALTDREAPTLVLAFDVLGTSHGGGKLTPPHELVGPRRRRAAAVV
jgi:hypothetical protein